MNTARRNFLSAILGAGVILPAIPSLSQGNILDHLKYAWRSMETKEMLSALPMRNPCIQARRDGDFVILADTNKNTDVLKINARASDIWNLCDGQNSARDIVRTILNTFDVDPAQCTRDVMVTLLAFKRKGFVIV